MVEKKIKNRKNQKFVKKRLKVKKIEHEIDDEKQVEEAEEAAIPKWYNQLTGDKYDYEKLSEEQLVSLRIEAQQVLDEETKTYNDRKGKVKNGSNAAWINTVLKKGTSKDKVAANVVTIQNSPLHTLSNLTALVNSVNPAKKKECTLVMETLSELFIEDLLRPERKLRPFDKQPLSILNKLSGGCLKGRRLRLSLWLFEDKLKDLYEQFVHAINNVAKDTVEMNRIKAVSVMYRLLSSHPEQEQVLLNNLINKMGDPQQKVVSKVIYCLTQLLKLHPNMKQIIMNEVEKLLFRPNISCRTQYYSICFLSQFIFESEDTDIARNIIKIYFSFFKALIKKGEIDTRLMGALLMGVKRAHPYAKLDSTAIADHIDTLYKLVHLTPFNIALHALSLLQVISNETNDRFYSALYKKLLDPNLNNSCHHAMFINLMYKALSRDTNTSRVKGFIKRLFQVCLYAPVPLVCGVLYMISQLISRRKFSLIAFNVEPQQDAFASFTQSKEEKEEDEEEKYVDVDKEEEECGIEEVKEEDEEEKKPLRGWVHSELTRRTSVAWTSLYDPLTRNPAYCNADKTAYIELLYLTKHFHPTVALFSNKIIKQEIISYTGDPLVDFTLAKFLERFVFKNPKIKGSEEEKGPDPQLAQRKYYNPTGVRALQVTSTSYLAKDVKDIPVDELFLYRYLKEKYTNRPVAGNEEEDDDNASVTSEDFHDMMDKMYSGKKQKTLDFMDEIGSNLKNKTSNKGKKNIDDDDETDDGEEEEEVSDVDDETEEEFSEMEGEDDDDEVLDFGEEVGDFDGELDFDEALGNKSKRLEKEKYTMESQKKGKTKKSNKDDIQNLLAPAEEFAEILEEAGSSKHKPGMAGTFDTMDNAAAKQLDWEVKRDRWVKDSNRKRKWKGKKQNNHNNMKKRKR